MKAMAEMGYLAANVGEQDLLIGHEYLKYVSDFTGVPLLSANIANVRGEKVFQQSVTQQINASGKPATVAVTGVISPDFKEAVEETNPDLIVEDYGPVLEKLIPQLRKKADMLILLGHMTEEEARVTAAGFPEIDLIIASHSGDDPNLAPVTVGNTSIAYAGAKGMHVGICRFTVGGGRAKFQSYTAKKLDKTIADSDRILTVLDDYQQMVKAESLLESLPRTEHPEAEFTGNKSCMKCHSWSSYRFRKKDKHAHAFEPIAKKGREYDPECVECHTVGFGYLTGFITPDSTPQLENVGCENCHGPGGKHIKEPFKNKYGEVKQETCETCHNPENSPKFIYKERIKKIRHKGFFLCSARICHWFN
ncbi:MAG: NapC/NirT family cytochrome c [Candidatus Lindowbacteria bacterium]|nr:NapC/NirT family cytochrome c [Candidatus Lindowbacteria bacterium]